MCGVRSVDRLADARSSISGIFEAFLTPVLVSEQPYASCIGCGLGMEKDLCLI